MGKLPVTGPALQLSPQLAAESATGSRAAEWHPQQCSADVCFRASAPTTPPPAQRTQQAQHGSTKQLCPDLAHSLSHSGHTALPENCRSQPPEEKLLWWPVDHVTVHGSRLAVGDSCYIITGQCLLCKADDDLDMVECTQCNRFTHFQCTYPKLVQPPAGDFLCHFCSNKNPVPCKQTAQAMIDAGIPGVGVMWVTFMYGEMYRGGWQSQSIWMQGFMYSKKLGPSNELVLCSVLADVVAPEAVLGVCPVDVQPESKLASPSRERSDYWCTASSLGAVDDWGKLLFDSTVEQYGDMYSERPPREMEQFIHSYRLPHPDTYKSMLTMAATQGCTSARLASNLDHQFEPSSKRRRCDEEVYLRRIRSLVQPLQVEVTTKAPSSGGSAVKIHRYMTAGSCIGVEVWQPSGLLGKPLEAELTSLVQHWEVTEAADYITSVVDSPTAKRRKVYFGCRDIHNDPQLYWDVEPVPTIITDRLLPRLVQLGVITAVSDIHQAVLNIYHKGGYLVAHQDNEAHYQQPVIMIQVRSESALSFGYKPGGWSHLNENLRFLRIQKPLFSLMVLKNEAFNVLKHCVCSGDTQSGLCTTLVLRSITPSQKP